jgi:hypothetical protein
MPADAARPAATAPATATTAAGRPPRTPVAAAGGGAATPEPRSVRDDASACPGAAADVPAAAAPSGAQGDAHEAGVPPWAPPAVFVPAAAETPTAGHNDCQWRWSSLQSSPAWPSLLCR